jgi:hypothetical protein
MLARENPHCGVSGVPFMNSTTGADPTALLIAERVSEERRRAWRGVRNCGRRKVVGVRVAVRTTCGVLDGLGRGL